MNYEDFLKPAASKETSTAEASVDENAPEELDVQKVVVEELAADKAALNDELAEKIKNLEAVAADLELANIEISRLQGEIVRMKGELAREKELTDAAKSETSRVQDQLAVEREKQFDQQERNPNALALIDRDIELPDRFPGETRDHVLEAIAAARTQAESEGRNRCAQVLEGVLVANDPNGTLAKKREELKKLFAENGNIVNGTVIEGLKKLGLSHKNGEDYLLVDEILKRSY